MNQILDHLMEKLLKDGFARSEDAEIVRFGLELTFMRTIISAATIIVAFALDSAPAVIAFMAVYQPLRSFCGGYHAKTRTLCFLFSMLEIVSVITATKILTYKFCHSSALFFIISGLTMIITFAPTDTPSKPFDTVERIVFRKRSLIALFYALIMADICMYFSHDTMLLAVSLAVFFTGFLLVIGRLTKKKGAIA